MLHAGCHSQLLTLHPAAGAAWCDRYCNRSFRPTCFPSEVLAWLHLEIVPNPLPCLLSRTVALVAVAAFSAKLSGATAPPPPPYGFFSLLVGGMDGKQRHAGDAEGTGYGVFMEWWAFLVKGLALDLLGAHFKGMGSALACMWVDA